MSEAEQIASKLTEAQQEVLAHANCRSISAKTALAFDDLGIMEWSSDWSRGLGLRLTPLGLSVRQILLSGDQ